MNRLKSIFISIYPVLAVGISGYGIYQLAITGLDLIWLGAVMISLPIMIFIGRVMMFKDMARTSAHFPLITLLAFVGLALNAYTVISAIADTRQLTQSELIGIGLSCASFVCYMLYNFWYSSLGRRVHEKLSLGKPLPLFSLTKADGKQINSADFKGKANIMIFFRGNWCPLCMAQIKEVADSYKQLASLGAEITLISPQPEENTQILANKFNVPFNFLTDVDNKAAKILGIDMKNGLPAGMEILGYDKDTVYPTVIITDADGLIIYTDFTNNYRVRPEPDEFIKILQANNS